MQEDFNPAAHGLKTVHCVDIGGMVFICLAEVPPTFADLAGPLSRYLAPAGLKQARVPHVSTIIEKGNRKLVIENNRECYHCGGAQHRQKRIERLVRHIGQPAGARDPAFVAAQIAFEQPEIRLGHAHQIGQIDLIGGAGQNQVSRRCSAVMVSGVRAGIFMVLSFKRAGGGSWRGGCGARGDRRAWMPR